MKPATCGSAWKAKPGAARFSSGTSGTSGRLPSRAIAGPCPACRSSRRAPTGFSSGTSSEPVMDIGEPIRCFGKVNMAALGDAIRAQDESAWNENEQRQKDYEVHEQTRSIVLLFANLDGWPGIDVTKQPGWDRL